MELLKETCRQIGPVDQLRSRLIRDLLEEMLPEGRTLGHFSTLAGKYGAIVGTQSLPEIHPCMVVACADHGVARNGVSAYPVDTTWQMTRNYVLSRGASANAFANYCGAEMVVADVGVAGELSDVADLWHRKIAWGTCDFTRGSAMSREQAVQSVEIGIEIVQEQVRKGRNCFSLGEMGIGNTTASAAIVAAFTRMSPEEVTGRGTGISDAKLRYKVAVVRTALAVNRPDPQDGLDVLSKVGGFEIGTLAGVVLGAAAARCPVVIDGLNTTAAALIADAIHPCCRQYLFSSHLSGEPAHIHALGQLNLEPCLDMGVRLGEAIGASVVVQLLKVAVGLTKQQVREERLQHES